MIGVSQTEVKNGRQHDIAACLVGGGQTNHLEAIAASKAAPIPLPSSVMSMCTTDWFVVVLWMYFSIEDLIVGWYFNKEPDAAMVDVSDAPLPTLSKQTDKGMAAKRAHLSLKILQTSWTIRISSFLGEIPSSRQSLFKTISVWVD